MQAIAEHMQALRGTAALGRRHAARWRRQGVLAMVVLGHVLSLIALGHVANQHLARDGRTAPPVPMAPMATTLRLVVQLLPLASRETPHASVPQVPARSVPAPISSLLPRPLHADAGAAGAVPPAPAVAAAVELPSASGVQLDTQTLRRALDDAEAGTVRGLAKRAGRLDEVERLRADPLAGAMASAGRTALREGAQARVADDAKCKQELGKSGVGEMNRDNDRDTFMSTYIGAGKDCKR